MFLCSSPALMTGDEKKKKKNARLCFRTLVFSDEPLTRARFLSSQHSDVSPDASRPLSAAREGGLGPRHRAAMAGDDFARVVSALRELPFALRQISESDFASGDADRARRVARDAFHALAPFDEPAWTPSRDADAEDPPARASARLLVAFLAVVKYPPARDDAGALTRAFAPDAFSDASADDASSAVDALKRAVRWVVEHREKCATRAHVAHHIADVAGSIPVEMRGDPEMAEALDAQDRARRAYVAAHKKYEKNRKQLDAEDSPPSSSSSRMDVSNVGMNNATLGAAALTRAVADLEDEKDSLTKKIEAVERKIESRVGVDGKHLASLAATAREEKRVESETRRAAASARERAEAADARRRRAAVKLREILKSLGDEESGSLATLERLRAETERARVEVSETLPEALEEKRRRERALLDASDEKNLDENALREWASEVNALNASVESDARFVEAKEKERDEERDPAARQQASLAKSVRAKREAASSARDRLAARLRRAEDELRALEEGAQGGERGSPRKRVPDEDEEERTETVDDPETTSTRRAYATLKPRLDDANAESATLARTAAILRDQLAGVLDGTRGTSARTSDDADAEKAASATKEKASLARRVAELREKRAAFAALEQTYEERRRAFESAVDAHRSGYERLERETTALKNRVRGDETAFFKTRIERAFLSVSAERASGARGDALVRAHEGLLRDAQKTTETLRELDSNAGESGVGLTLDQMGSLRDMHRLIETRLRVTREKDAASGDAGGKRDGADVLSV